MNTAPLRRSILTLLVLCMTSLSCTEVGVRRWEAFDYLAFLDGLDRPDGVLDEDSIAELSVRAQNMRDALQSFAAAVEAIREAATETSPDPYAGATMGTNLFVDISCPGPDLLMRATNFEYGRIHLESPGLLVEAAAKWKIEEDLLLTAEDCRIGPYMFTGESPGWLDPETKDLAIELRFDITEVNDGSITVVDLPLLFTPTGIWVIVRLAGSDYTIGFDTVGGFMVSIRGAETEVSCDLSLFPPVCTTGG